MIAASAPLHQAGVPGGPSRLAHSLLLAAILFLLAVLCGAVSAGASEEAVSPEPAQILSPEPLPNQSPWPAASDVKPTSGNCPIGYFQRGSSCIPNGADLCTSTTWCDPGSTCCGNGCCPYGTQCTYDGRCMPDGWTACGSGYCQSGYYCSNRMCHPYSN